MPCLAGGLPLLPVAERPIRADRPGCIINTISSLTAGRDDYTWRGPQRTSQHTAHAKPKLGLAWTWHAIILVHQH